jgi:hypothetical protein
VIDFDVVLADFQALAWASSGGLNPDNLSLKNEDAARPKRIRFFNPLLELSEWSGVVGASGIGQPIANRCPALAGYGQGFEAVGGMMAK